MSISDRLESEFEKMFSGSPSLIASAPGRVNLIGEHTDYNDGWVMPMAIGFGTVVGARPRSDRLLRVAALDLGACCELDLSTTIGPARHGDWSNYVRGVAVALKRDGLEIPGADIAIAGNVPQGAGLSSSASLEIATALALATLAGSPDFDRTAMARAGQRAEHEFAGCQCGIMDQLVSASATPGAALLIDCRSLLSKPVPVPSDAAILIVHSGVTRGLVEGEYNKRRRQCEAAAAAMGVKALRDVEIATLVANRALLPAETFRRALHVVTENTRTLAAADALSSGDLATLGRLMVESHGSMRDDFAITTPELDQLSEFMSQRLDGKGGARMTGGGFGGAAIAIGARPAIEAVAEDVLRSYRTPRGDAPMITIETPSAGARLLRA